MNFIANLNMRCTCVSLACLIFLVVLTIYIASEGQGMFYHIKENTLCDKKDCSSDNRETQYIPKDIKASVNDLTPIEEKDSPFKEKDYQKSTRHSAVSLYTPQITALHMSTKISASSSHSSITFDVTQPTTTFSAREDDFISETVHSINSNGLSLNTVSDVSEVSAFTNLNETVDQLKNSPKEIEKVIPLFKTREHLATSQQLHSARILRIKDACSTEKVIREKMHKIKTKKVIYRSKNYDFAYCKVPKSGSTFWTKAFGVLEHGLAYGDIIFKNPRSSVHLTMMQYVTDIDSIIKDKTRTILVSRDPYSRLYSAYIDKSFLLLMIGINYRIRNISRYEMYNSTECPTDVTFQEFLDWILFLGLNGMTMDRHWAPVFSMCYPCAVNSFILVKQETFSSDVEFALKQLGVEKEKFDYITRALHDHRAEFSLPGIIDTLFHIAKVTIKVCLGYADYSRRVWKSLQFQGYIDENLGFPVEKFQQDQFSNHTYFTEIVLRTIKDFPMSSSQSKTQRQKHLYLAYKSVKPDTLQGIQHLFKDDFEIFRYSKLPPTEHSPQLNII